MHGGCFADFDEMAGDSIRAGIDRGSSHFGDEPPAAMDKPKPATIRAMAETGGARTRRQARYAAIAVTTPLY